MYTLKRSGSDSNTTSWSWLISSQKSLYTRKKPSPAPVCHWHAVSKARSASLATCTCRSQPLSAFATSFDAFESPGRTLNCGRFMRCSFSTWFWCGRILLMTNVGRENCPGCPAICRPFRL
jgi:hypothetical protein